MHSAISVDIAYQSCLDLANTHYENFPVASRLLPAWLRPPIAAIYAFARKADDFADEGTIADAERLALLNGYNTQLEALARGDSTVDPVFIALGHTINTYNLAFGQFHKLLAAFKQDVIKTRYENMNDVLAYCDNSANPVGHLLLCLFKRDSRHNIECSNNICSALQIINFLQDIAVDYKKGRIYLPLDEMQQHGITEADIAGQKFTKEWQAFMEQQLDRVEKMMQQGAPLARALPGRVGFEIRLTVVGGLTIIKKLRNRNKTGFTNQPRLRLSDWVKMLTKSVYYPYK